MYVKRAIVRSITLSRDTEDPFVWRQPAEASGCAGWFVMCKAGDEGLLARKSKAVNAIQVHLKDSISIMLSFRPHLGLI